MIFCQKNAIWGEYSYVKHTLFILYLEGNHTLFGEKLYFIWKFCSGNTDFYEIRLFYTVHEGGATENLNEVLTELAIYVAM